MRFFNSNTVIVTGRRLIHVFLPKEFMVTDIVAIAVPMMVYKLVDGGIFLNNSSH